MGKHTLYIQFLERKPLRVYADIGDIKENSSGLKKCVNLFYFCSEKRGSLRFRKANSIYSLFLETQSISSHFIYRILISPTSSSPNTFPHNMHPRYISNKYYSFYKDTKIPKIIYQTSIVYFSFLLTQHYFSFSIMF